MKRELTNALRFVIDECLPPILRDKRWFMYPVYILFFRGNIPKYFIDFKDVFLELSDEKIRDLYLSLPALRVSRGSDLSRASLLSVIEELDRSAGSLLDVGCGDGSFLGVIKERGWDVVGCDIVSRTKDQSTTYVRCSADNLPFQDNSFDVVTCHHTLEHVLDLNRAISELKRVARKQVIVTVPCQRYYRYTVDLHLHFFPQESFLVYLMGLDNYSCKKVRGDFVYVGYLS